MPTPLIVLAPLACLLLAGCGSGTPSASTSPSGPDSQTASPTSPPTTPTAVAGDTARPLPPLVMPTAGPALAQCDPNALKYTIITDHTAYGVGQPVKAVEVVSATVGPCALVAPCYPSLRVQDDADQLLNFQITNYACVRRPPFTVSSADTAIDVLAWNQVAACAPRSPDPVCGGGQVPAGRYKVTGPAPAPAAPITIG